jgi:hypothetical protein
MVKLMSIISFKLMSLMFKVRDIFLPRLDVLNITYSSPNKIR